MPGRQKQRRARTPRGECAELVLRAREDAPAATSSSGGGASDPSAIALRSAARCTCRCDTAEARRPRSSRPTLWRRQQLCTSAAALCVPLRMQLRTAAAAPRTLRGRAPRCAAGCRVVRGRACAAAAAARTRAQHPAARHAAGAPRSLAPLLSGAGTSAQKNHFRQKNVIQP